MTLKFKPERLAIIKRLKDLTISEIENKMMEIGGRKNRISIDRWTKDGWNPESFEKVEWLAEATGMPIGFYYYNNVSIEMRDMWVTIIIKDTNEVVAFRFM